MTVFFWIFAVMTAGAGLLAITRRSGVAAALWAAVCFIGIAGEMVLMRAYFLAVVEVLVYAGAIMVLFLFVIMLLNLREQDVAKLTGPRLHIVGVIIGVAFLGALVWTCRRAGLYEIPLAGAPAGEPRAVARPLFLHYLLPFEIASFLLLSAIIGSVLITKRRLR
ncbi:MAG: NADH-quinone oxidoreductase subunit J family protein [Planctomycetota bacterium]